ncbi:MAG: alcohol dehydrogenase [Gammaproteobacteria bacterium]|nr:alcohol dehydrogenase [Gammaproteobacteria bacterium]
MKAIVMRSPGGPDELIWSDVETPVIKSPTDIKVQLMAAGVNPIDTKIRKQGLLGPWPLPAILGCDGAGIVMEVGSGVDRFKVGDRVWFCHGGLGLDPGNYAEWTVLDQRWAAPMPESLDFIEAAAGPLVLITAIGMLRDRGRLDAQKTVLIHGGAGGVGHVAIQIAKHMGARVITTVGTKDHDFAKSLGADETIDYSKEDFVVEVNHLTQGLGADLVIDMVSSEVFSRSIHCTRAFGDLVTLLDPGPIDLKEARLRNLRIGFELMLTPQLRDMEAARLRQVEMLNFSADLIARGQLRLEVGKVLPLGEAAKAHRLLEDSQVLGKIVLEVNPSP